MKPINECIAYVGGTFDFLHSGHLNFLCKAKETFAKVIVSLNTDEFCSRYKRKPFFSFDERKQMLESCKFVDHVITNVGNENSSIAILQVKPDYIVHGDDWTGDSLLKQMGLDVNFLVENQIRLYHIPYTRGISTSILLARMNVKNNRKVELVVAQYTEQVQWVYDSGLPAIIYHKVHGVEVDGVAKREELVESIPIQVDDVGREGSTFLKHIIAQYDDLAEWTCFLQGRISDHAGDIRPYIEYSKPFKWIANRTYETMKDGSPHGHAHCQEVFEYVFDMPCPEKFVFGLGGMFMVSRDSILSRPKSFYIQTLERLHKISKERGIAHWGTHCERWWDYLFLNQPIGNIP